MKRTIAVVGACSVLGLIHLGAFGQTIYIPQPEPYTNDAGTVLLEHFDGATTGSKIGSITYTNGMFGLGVHTAPRASLLWLIFGQFCEGTVEFWGKLDTVYLAEGQWGSQGRGLFVWDMLGEQRDATFQTGVFNTNAVRSTCYLAGGPTVVQADVAVAPNVWHHYATTWGSQGVRLYFDGALVDSATNTAPLTFARMWSIGGPTSTPDPEYPSGLNCVIDELRLSGVQRTFAPLPRPSLSIAVSKVKVTQYVIVGHTYVMDCSTDLDTWTQMGEPFVATTGSVTEEYDVDVVGRFFRIREVK